MKVFIKIILLIGGLLTITFLLGYRAIENRISLSEYNDSIQYNVFNDSILKIGIIGDSWAVNANRYLFGKYIDSLYNLENIKSNTFYIYGLNGSKSKDIYQNLIDNQLINQHKMKFDYCIVFAGINDLHGQYGAEFYSYHIKQIINYLLNRHITPIIIEIPNFDILEQYKLYPLWKFTLYKLLSLYTSGNIHANNIQKYRSSFENIINNKNINNSIIYIKTDSIFMGKNDLFTDYMHINHFAYKELGNLIKKEIDNKNRKKWEK